MATTTYAAPRQRRVAVNVVTTAVASLLLLLLSSVLLSAHTHGVRASCPTNGNTHAVYVTSNMGDNIWSFDTNGNYLGEVLNASTFPRDVQVHKLRAMRFGPGGYLYVLSASGAYSRVFAVSGNGVVNGTLARGCTRDYRFTVVQQDTANPLLDHPYDLVFHPVTGDLYVANQNSITITRYTRRDTKGGKGDRKLDKDNDSDYPSWQPAANVPGAMPSSTTSTTTTTSSLSARGGKKAAAAMAVGRAQVEQQQQQPDETTTTAAAAAAGSGHGKARHGVRVPDDTGLFASAWSTSYTLDSIRGIALSPPLPRAVVEDGLYRATPTSTAAAATADNDDNDKATVTDANNAKTTRDAGRDDDEDVATAYYLLACDVASNTLHVFDAATGERLFGISVPSPVQVVFPSRYFAATTAAAAAASAAATATTRARKASTALPVATATTTTTTTTMRSPPYVYVTSREDGMVYLVRLTANTPSVHGLQPLPAVTGRARGDARSRRGGAAGATTGETMMSPAAFAVSDARHVQYYPITRAQPLHSASGLYENAMHDTLLVGDRSGRRVVSYVSPFLANEQLDGADGGNNDNDSGDVLVTTSTTTTTSYAAERRAARIAPSPFLGYYLRRLPDQPEFITMTLLETQANIPYCYELTADGTFRYAALCTAGYIWSVLLAIVLVVVPSMLLYKQVRHMMRQRRRLAAAEAAAREHDESAPLMGTSGSGSACAGGGGYAATTGRQQQQQQQPRSAPLIASLLRLRHQYHRVMTASSSSSGAAAAATTTTTTSRNNSNNSVRTRTTTLTDAAMVRSLELQALRLLGEADGAAASASASTRDTAAATAAATTAHKDAATSHNNNNDDDDRALLGMLSDVSPTAAPTLTLFGAEVGKLLSAASTFGAATTTPLVRAALRWTTQHVHVLTTPRQVVSLCMPLLSLRDGATEGRRYVLQTLYAPLLASLQSIAHDGHRGSSTTTTSSALSSSPAAAAADVTAAATTTTTLAQQRMAIVSVFSLITRLLCEPHEDNDNNNKNNNRAAAALQDHGNDAQLAKSLLTLHDAACNALQRVLAQQQQPQQPQPQQHGKDAARGVLDVAECVPLLQSLVALAQHDARASRARVYTALSRCLVDVIVPALQPAAATAPSRASARAGDVVTLLQSLQSLPPHHRSNDNDDNDDSSNDEAADGGASVAVAVTRATRVAVTLLPSTLSSASVRDVLAAVHAVRSVAVSSSPPLALAGGHAMRDMLHVLRPRLFQLAEAQPPVLRCIEYSQLLARLSHWEQQQQRATTTTTTRHVGVRLPDDLLELLCSGFVRDVAAAHAAQLVPFAQGLARVAHARHAQSQQQRQQRDAKTTHARSGRGGALPTYVTHAARVVARRAATLSDELTVADAATLLLSLAPLHGDDDVMALYLAVETKLQALQQTQQQQQQQRSEDSDSNDNIPLTDGVAVLHALDAVAQLPLVTSSSSSSSRHIDDAALSRVHALRAALQHRVRAAAVHARTPRELLRSAPLLLLQPSTRAPPQAADEQQQQQQQQHDDDNTTALAFVQRVQALSAQCTLHECARLSMAVARAYTTHRVDAHTARTAVCRLLQRGSYTPHDDTTTTQTAAADSNTSSSSSSSEEDDVMELKRLVDAARLVELCHNVRTHGDIVAALLRRVAVALRRHTAAQSLAITTRHADNDDGNDDDGYMATTCGAAASLRRLLDVGQSLHACVRRLTRSGHHTRPTNDGSSDNNDNNSKEHACVAVTSGGGGVSVVSAVCDVTRAYASCVLVLVERNLHRRATPLLRDVAEAVHYTAQLYKTAVRLLRMHAAADATPARHAAMHDATSGAVPTYNATTTIADDVDDDDVAAAAVDDGDNDDDHDTRVADALLLPLSSSQQLPPPPHATSPSHSTRLHVGGHRAVVAAAGDDVTTLRDALAEALLSLGDTTRSVMAVAAAEARDDNDDNDNDDVDSTAAATTRRRHERATVVALAPRTLLRLVQGYDAVGVVSHALFAALLPCLHATPQRHRRRRRRRRHVVTAMSTLQLTLLLHVLLRALVCGADTLSVVARALQRRLRCGSVRQCHAVLVGLQRSRYLPRHVDLTASPTTRRRRRLRVRDDNDNDDNDDSVTVPLARGCVSRLQAHVSTYTRWRACARAGALETLVGVVRALAHAATPPQPTYDAYMAAATRRLLRATRALQQRRQRDDSAVVTTTTATTLQQHKTLVGALLLLPCVHAMRRYDHRCVTSRAIAAAVTTLLSQQQQQHGDVSLHAILSAPRIAALLHEQAMHKLLYDVDVLHGDDSLATTTAATTTTTTTEAATVMYAYLLRHVCDLQRTMSQHDERGSDDDDATDATTRDTARLLQSVTRMSALVATTSTLAASASDAHSDDSAHAWPRLLQRCVVDAAQRRVAAASHTASSSDDDLAREALPLCAALNACMAASVTDTTAASHATAASDAAMCQRRACALLSRLLRAVRDTYTLADLSAAHAATALQSCAYVAANVTSAGATTEASTATTTTTTTTATSGDNDDDAVQSQLSADVATLAYALRVRDRHMPVAALVDALIACALLLCSSSSSSSSSDVLRGDARVQLRLVSELLLRLLTMQLLRANTAATRAVLLPQLCRLLCSSRGAFVRFALHARDVCKLDHDDNSSSSASLSSSATAAAATTAMDVLSRSVYVLLQTTQSPASSDTWRLSLQSCLAVAHIVQRELATAAATKTTTKAAAAAADATAHDDSDDDDERVQQQQLQLLTDHVEALLQQCRRPHGGENA